MKVVFFQRKPVNYFSIERLFESIRKALPNEIEKQVCISSFSSRGVFRRIFNILEACRRQSGDVNHITGDVHYISYFMKKSKTVLTIHDLVPLKVNTGIKRYVIFFFWYWLPLKRCKYVTVISEKTKSELLENVRCKEKDIRVICNCIPDGFVYNEKKFNKSRPVLLQIGTKENKNLLRVAEAVAGLCCHLRIIGKLAEEQVEILNEYGVDYSNAYNLSDTEIVLEYKNCDVLIFVSTYEGFGLPVVEAQASGRPVVTSNISPMLEVAGSGGTFVDPYSVSSIRHGIGQVLDDEKYRAKMIQSGIENSNKYRSSFVAREYEKLYLDVHLGK